MDRQREGERSIIGAQASCLSQDLHCESSILSSSGESVFTRLQPQRHTTLRATSLLLLLIDLHLNRCALISLFTIAVTADADEWRRCIKQPIIIPDLSHTGLRSSFDEYVDPPIMARDGVLTKDFKHQIHKNIRYLRGKANKEKGNVRPYFKTASVMYAKRLNRNPFPLTPTYTQISTTTI